MKKIMMYVIALLIVFATLTPIASTVEAATTTLTSYQTKTAVYLRATTSYKGKQLILIPKQKTVTYVAKKGSWLQVRYANRTGYVNEQSLTRKVQKGVALKAAPYVTQRQVIVYSRVDAHKKQAFTLKKGTTVTVNEQLAGFYKIRYGNKTGWVAAKDMKTSTVAVSKPIKKTSFLSKQKSMDYLKKYKSVNQNRFLFTIKSEHGYQFVNSHLFQTTVPMDEYLFVIGGYDKSKLSSLMFVRSRYDKYPTGQATGNEAVHAGLAGFFGEGTKETEALRKLYAQHKNFKKNEVIPITIGGHKGILLLWEKRIEFIFDYDGDLPIIRI
ncbi:SH3 domain-containing protein [Exiguobacterium sp. s6]|uniref:SH3 domain-containing protein n=1 Tax=Exiguobacterium sp. s6 TaxID=2751236 RepID=UPI001BE8CD82|nr:SH3 domain-containing protein [Exiguobacterium sp. s6]